MGILPLNSLANRESGYLWKWKIIKQLETSSNKWKHSIQLKIQSYLVNVSKELVYIVPPTSMWTGAVYPRIVQ